MNFVSPSFLFFFLLFLGVRWILIPGLIKLGSIFPYKNSHPSFKKLYISGKAASQLTVSGLLIGSYVFYANWNYKFLSLLFFTSYFDFWIGRQLGERRKTRTRKLLIFLSIFLNLSILAFFKYFYFIYEIFTEIGNWASFPIQGPEWNILLPAGISFYTFQSLSYTIDVYRNVIKPEKKFLHYALFLAFFPQLVAGPIVVAKEFLPQISLAFRKKFEEIRLNQAFYFILLGFIKKSVLADNISVISDAVFVSSEHIVLLSWSYILFGMISYSIQIYGDFSGYTDIARGVAILFGFHLPENFNLPYLASSLTDFWKRWHISLSSWLRSYLYIPLGGNRFSQIFTYRNLLITMVLGGLWHGASWNFLLWGGAHGIYLGIERFCIGKFSEKFNFSDVRPFLRRFFKVSYVFFTFSFVTALWVFFRSPNLQVSFSIFKGLFNLQSGLEPSYQIEMQFYFYVLVVFISHLIGYFYYEKINRFVLKESSYWQFPVYAFLSIFAVLYSGELRPFIYFVF